MSRRARAALSGAILAALAGAAFAGPAHAGAPPPLSGDCSRVDIGSSYGSGSSG